MAHGVIVVKTVLDPDAGVWIVESSSLPGLRIEATTVEEFAKKLPLAIEDLIADSEVEGVEDGSASHDVPIELIANFSIWARVRAAA